MKRSDPTSSRLRTIRFPLAVLAAATVAGVTAVAVPSSADRDNRLATVPPRPAPTHSLSDAVLAAEGAQAVAAVPTPAGGGFWVAWSNGTVTTSGNAVSYGDASHLPLSAPIVGMTATPDGKGYWLLSANGGVLSYGDARFFGSAGRLHLSAPADQIMATPDGAGYRFFTINGGVLDYGDAGFYGTPHTLGITRPIVGGAETASGDGYWMVTSAGGVFTYGDARFHGAASVLHLGSPIVAMAATPDGGGYWLLTAAGGIFSYGDAGFHGAAVGDMDGGHAVGVIASQTGDGYWVVDSNGQVLSYGSVAPVDGEQTSGAASPGYAFEVVNAAGTPARWDPCDTIDYAVVSTGAPTGWQADVTDDIDQVAAATGITFADEGTFDSASDVPSDATLTISWVPSLDSADPLGVTNYWYYEAAGYEPQIMSAQIELLQGLQAGADGEQPVLLHELGHAMGLAQSAGNEVMDPADEGYTTFQSGDLAGLGVLGADEGCANFYS